MKIVKKTSELEVLVSLFKELGLNRFGADYGCTSQWARIIGKEGGCGK